jgi:DNA-directed RNA polymerase subunit RPC12/RpoP
MSIVFNCTQCGRKIEAADSAGGKWGKCPSCRARIYVPDAEPGNEFKLAPIDESEEQKRKQLMAETYEINQAILEEKDVPEGQAEASEPPVRISEKDLSKNIILCLRLMADGNMAQAEQLARGIAAHRRQAIKIIDRIALSEMPDPELGDVPGHVLSGLIRSLRAKIG